MNRSGLSGRDTFLSSDGVQSAHAPSGRTFSCLFIPHNVCFKSRKTIRLLCQRRLQQCFHDSGRFQQLDMRNELQLHLILLTSHRVPRITRIFQNGTSSHLSSASINPKASSSQTRTRRALASPEHPNPSASPLPLPVSVCRLSPGAPLDTF